MVVAATYTPTATDIIHSTDADLVIRQSVSDPIHLMQYDENLPIIEVRLWKNNEKYKIPANAEVNVRLEKPNGKNVYNHVLGLFSDRTGAYIQVTEIMSDAHGDAIAIIEIKTAENKVVGTASFSVIFDYNPVQRDGIRASSEFKALNQYVEEAEESAAEATIQAVKAANSASASASSASAAKSSETKAKTSETNAKSSETKAKASETAAKNSQDAAKTSEDNAKSSETKASTYANKAEDSSKKAQSFAVGTDNEYRDGDSKDNSLYYYEQCKLLVQGYEGIMPMGTITFAELSDPDNQVPKYMFNISNAFTSDDRFNDGGGKEYGPGMNVFYTMDEKWDVMTSASVLGVKGDNEDVYHQGNVSLSAEDVGAFPEETSILVATDLNDVIETGFYYSNNRADILNKPEGTGVFSLLVFKTSTSNKVITQYFISTNNGNLRHFNRYTVDKGVTWFPWIELLTGIKGANETEYRGGNVNLTPENIGAVPWYNSTIIGADTDWNTIVNPGCYKVTNATMDNAHHAPNGLYSYGILYVFWGGNNTDNDHRKNQVYIPDGAGDDNRIAIRAYWNPKWRNWSIFNDNAKNDLTYVKKAGDEMTGNLVIGGNDKGLVIHNAENTERVFFGTSSDGTMVGLWDSITRAWVYFFNRSKQLLKFNSKVELNNVAEFKRSTGQGVYRGVNGTTGWLIFAQIETGKAYDNDLPIEFKIGRAGKLGTILSVVFKKLNSTDPDLNSFEYYGGNGDVFRIKRTEQSKWQLIAKKSSAYDEIYVMQVNSQGEFGKANHDHNVVTYPNTMFSGEPDSTWIAPTLGGEIGYAETTKTMTAATASAAGKSGGVPFPSAGEQNNYLTGAGTWQNVDDHAAAFTSADVADGSITEWTTVAKLASGETHKSIFNKVSTMFKNVRYLYKLLGTTDISAIGDGTVKGAINALNTGLVDFKGISTPIRDVAGDLFDTTYGNGWYYFADLSINTPETYGICFVLKINNWDFRLAIGTSKFVYTNVNIGQGFGSWQKL